MSQPLRVTLISHSCVIPDNQKLFAGLSRFPDLDLSLIAPARWRAELRGDLTFAPLPELAARARPLPVRLPGSLHFHSYPDLPGTLRELAPEVVFLDEDPHSLVAWQALRARRKLGFRLVATLKQNISKGYPPPFGWIEAAVYRAAAAAAATSQECLGVARAKGFTGAAAIIPYAVDTEACAPAAEPAAPDRPFTVGYAGRLVPEKGVADLIAALAMVQETVPALLSVVADGPEQPALAKLAETALRPGTVTWSPAIAPDLMPNWYRGLDVLALPSRTTRGWKEQFGRVLAEAMACGVPVVGSSSGFIPELIATTGGGLAFREGDVAALADCLARLARDGELRGHLAAAGRAGVIGNYGLPVLAQRLHDLLLSVRPPP